MECFHPRKFLFVSLGVHGLLIGAATLWTTRTVRSEATATLPAFRAAPATRRVSPSLHALEHHVSLVRRRGGVPPVARRVLTIGPARAALPAVPVVASVPFIQPAVLVGGRHAEATGRTGTGRGPGSGGDDGDWDHAGRELRNLVTKLQVTEKRVGVVLDERMFYPPLTSNDPTVQQYRRANDAERDYIKRSFDPSHVAAYTASCLYVPWHYKDGSLDVSMASAILDLVNSPQQIDAIYVLGGFRNVTQQQHEYALHREREYYKGDPNNYCPPQDLWPALQKRVRERGIRLYLHPVVQPGERYDLKDPLTKAFFDFARSTGGSVKVGPVPRPGEEISAPSP